MRLLVLFTLLLLVPACREEAPIDETTAGNTELAELLTNYQEQRLQRNPLEATFIGDDRYNDQLPNYFSQAFQQENEVFYQKYQAALAQINRSTLSSADKVSYDVLNWECTINLAGGAFATALLPLNQFDGPHLMIGQLASGQSAQPFETVVDYENWLGRLDRFTIMMDTALVNMQRGMASGYLLPQSLSVKLLPQLQSLAAEPLEQHLFYGPVNLLTNTEMPAADRSRLTGAYREMIGGRIIPLFQRLSRFVENDYLPAGRTSSGIDAIPQGTAYYNYLIKYYTTTDMTAEEIHELGLREVARITAEMEKVKEEVGFTDDLKAFFDFVRTKPELRPFNDPEEVIANFNAIHDRMQPELAKLFDQVPETAFEVRRTEAFREASASAEYNPGSQDGSRPGIFYVPIPDVENYNLFSDEDLFLHEAIPGHHYQFSLTQENESLPDFRRSLWYSAYGEGWALYAESLGKELGLYTDPYQYFGMLSAEMHRAIRLVVDTGIHAKGWSREKAIQYSLDHEAESEASIVAEIERYMAIPGQALSYKIGQLKIRELRAQAEEQLGDQFDVKAFHNLVLSPGCVPLAVLETMVEEWLAAQPVS